MEKLKDILVKIKPEVDFENEKNLVDDGILDSIEIVTIIAEVEEEFGISVEPDEIDPDNFQSIEAIYRLIKSKENN